MYNRILFSFRGVDDKETYSLQGGREFLKRLIC